VVTDGSIRAADYTCGGMPGSPLRPMRGGAAAITISGSDSDSGGPR
jgi:hypothetical protein